MMKVNNVSVEKDYKQYQQNLFVIIINLYRPIGIDMLLRMFFKNNDLETKCFDRCDILCDIFNEI